jgi:sugar phosphate isomerase/epimerase
MNDLRFPIAAITDEFSPTDFTKAVDAMASIGMTGAELRVVNGKNIMDLTDDEVRAAKEACDARGIQVIGISSPILKCVLPNGPELDTRFQQDIFNSRHTFEDQPRLLDRAFQICEMTGAKIIRVFSYWRTVRPEACFDAVAAALTGLAEKAAPQGLTIGIENEHACHIGTAVEAKAILDVVRHANLKLVWDPANALVAGETPYPFGYRQLPKDRIAHVHVKDCHMEGHTPVWGPVGTRHVDWKGQIAALEEDGYKGYLSLETHWPGPGGDKFLGSTICGWNLRGLSAR